MKLRSRGFSVALIALTVMASSPSARGEGQDAAELIRFGAEMAEKGNWREARFRWEKAAALRPADPRIDNNLAVAAEALGDLPQARKLYERAVAGSGGDERIVENFALFQRHEMRIDPNRREEAGNAPPVTPASESRTGSKAKKVQVRLPVPARIDLSGVRTVLVAAFLARDSGIVDTSREVVRFLRGEFRKHTKLNVLDVTPPPAVPEQTLDEMVVNAEFWRRLGAEHSADLIVSGQVRFTRSDYSGFQEVDSISPVTGQKVRQTRFVEQEQFSYDMDILYFDGPTGGLRLRDHIRRSATYPGLANDPITALYGIGEAISGDVLAAVSARTREETRIVFRK